MSIVLEQSTNLSPARKFFDQLQQSEQANYQREFSSQLPQTTLRFDHGFSGAGTETRHSTGSFTVAIAHSEFYDFIEVPATQHGLPSDQFDAKLEQFLEQLPDLNNTAAYILERDPEALSDIRNTIASQKELYLSAFPAHTEAQPTLNPEEYDSPTDHVIALLGSELQLSEPIATYTHKYRIDRGFARGGQQEVSDESTISKGGAVISFAAYLEKTQAGATLSSENFQAHVRSFLEQSRTEESSIGQLIREQANAAQLISTFLSSTSESFIEAFSAADLLSLDGLSGAEAPLDISERAYMQDLKNPDAALEAFDDFRHDQRFAEQLQGLSEYEQLEEWRKIRKFHLSETDTSLQSLDALQAELK